MGILRLMFPSCKELAQRLSSGAYDRASWPERLAVRWHLVRCELCDRYARQLSLLAEGYRRAAAPAEKAGSAERKKRLVRRLRGE